MPSTPTVTNRRCPYCPSFLFMSETEKKKHLTIFHHDKKGKDDTQCLTSFPCYFFAIL